jgi:hypothetical protein
LHEESQGRRTWPYDGEQWWLIFCFCSSISNLLQHIAAKHPQPQSMWLGAQGRIETESDNSNPGPPSSTASELSTSESTRVRRAVEPGPPDPVPTGPPAAGSSQPGPVSAPLAGAQFTQKTIKEKREERKRKKREEKERRKKERREKRKERREKKGQGQGQGKGKKSSATPYQVRRWVEDPYSWYGGGYSAAGWIPQVPTEPSGHGYDQCVYCHDPVWGYNHICAEPSDSARHPSVSV